MFIVIAIIAFCRPLEFGNILIFIIFSTDVPQPSSVSVSVVALNEAGKVRVTWTKRILGSGQVITGYSVQYKRRGTASYTTRSVSGSSTTSYTITNLNLGTVYEVRVASVGPLGLSVYCCGSGKQVTTYSSECNAHACGTYPLQFRSCVCMRYKLTVICRSLSIAILLYAKLISMGFSYTCESKPG